jgi:hypothetical protein
MERNRSFGHNREAGQVFSPIYWLVLVLFFCLFSFHVNAQTTATVTGTVVDAQGKAIPDAAIEVTSAELSVTRTTTSESDGVYRLTALPPGTYSIKASHDGFKTELFRDIDIAVNRIVTYDIVLQVGTASQTVEVDSAVPLLETTISSSGTTITPQQIMDMPINGRNYLDLLQLVPGVSLNRQNDPAGDNATPILGERGGNTLYLIDGLPNKDNLNGGPSAQFNQDSILEFQVVTGGYKAEFGHASGGIVNVVTKSGTNDLH